MTDNRTDVRISGPEPQVVQLEETLGTNIITALAYAARKFDTMITITVSPYSGDETEETQRDPNDRP